MSHDRERPALKKSVAHNRTWGRLVGMSEVTEPGKATTRADTEMLRDDDLRDRTVHSMEHPEESSPYRRRSAAHD